MIGYWETEFITGIKGYIRSKVTVVHTEDQNWNPQYSIKKPGMATAHMRVATVLSGVKTEESLGLTGC